MKFLGLAYFKGIFLIIIIILGSARQTFFSTPTLLTYGIIYQLSTDISSIRNFNRSVSITYSVNFCKKNSSKIG